MPGQKWSSPTVEVDATEFPLVVTRYRGAVSDKDFEAHLRAMTSTMHLADKTAVVLDTTHGSARSVASLRMLREWMDAEHEAMAQRVAGVALVIPSAAVRFVLSTFLLTADVPHPFEVVDTLHAGLTYARRQLRLAQ